MDVNRHWNVHKIKPHLELFLSLLSRKNEDEIVELGYWGNFSWKLTRNWIKTQRFLIKKLRNSKVVVVNDVMEIDWSLQKEAIRKKTLGKSIQNFQSNFHLISMRLKFKKLWQNFQPYLFLLYFHLTKRLKLKNRLTKLLSSPSYSRYL